MVKKHLKAKSGQLRTLIEPNSAKTPFFVDFQSIESVDSPVLPVAAKRSRNIGAAEPGGEKKLTTIKSEFENVSQTLERLKSANQSKERNKTSKRAPRSYTGTPCQLEQMRSKIYELKQHVCN